MKLTMGYFFSWRVSGTAHGVVLTNAMKKVDGGLASHWKQVDLDTNQMYLWLCGCLVGPGELFFITRV